MKKILLILTASLGLIVTIPIWMVLLYKILVMIDATELMWFLYWIYLPSVVFTSLLGSAIKHVSED